ncbi:hypothetical protein AB3Y40_06670 [Yoonia sp. R2331]|uniref:hypothetical protein n=1 Tax=Yoonia sp. R2331 TaxID=3237238 RepID=UPI0034E5F820
MTDFDRIAASAPVSKQAAVSAKGGGQGYEMQTKMHQWPECPPLKDLTAVRKTDGFQDMTGRRGRFNVLGMLAHKIGPKDQKGHWVCRCDCGVFVGVKSKTLKNGMDRCPSCAQAALMRGEKLPWGMQIQFTGNLEWTRT